MSPHDIELGVEDALDTSHGPHGCVDGRMG